MAATASQVVKERGDGPSSATPRGRGEQTQQVALGMAISGSMLVHTLAGFLVRVRETVSFPTARPTFCQVANQKRPVM